MGVSATEVDPKPPETAVQNVILEVACRRFEAAQRPSDLKWPQNKFNGRSEAAWDHLHNGPWPQRTMNEPGKATKKLVFEFRPALRCLCHGCHQTL